MALDELKHASSTCINSTKSWKSQPLLLLNQPAASLDDITL